MSAALAWLKPSMWLEISREFPSSISTSATWSATAWSSASSKPTTNAPLTSPSDPAAHPARILRAHPATKVAASNCILMILNRQRSVRVSTRELDKFLVSALRRLRLPAGALTVCLVEKRDMSRWNLAYRGKKGPTDVLSFPTNGTQRHGKDP